MRCRPAARFSICIPGTLMNEDMRDGGPAALTRAPDASPRFSAGQWKSGATKSSSSTGKAREVRLTPGKLDPRESAGGRRYQRDSDETVGNDRDNNTVARELLTESQMSAP